MLLDFFFCPSKRAHSSLHIAVVSLTIWATKNTRKYKVLTYQHVQFIRIVGLFDIAMCNKISCARNPKALSNRTNGNSNQSDKKISCALCSLVQPKIAAKSHNFRRHNGRFNAPCFIYTCFLSVFFFFHLCHSSSSVRIFLSMLKLLIIDFNNNFGGNTSPNVVKFKYVFDEKKRQKSKYANEIEK